MRSLAGARSKSLLRFAYALLAHLGACLPCCLLALLLPDYLADVVVVVVASFVAAIAVEVSAMDSGCGDDFGSAGDAECSSIVCVLIGVSANTAMQNVDMWVSLGYCKISVRTTGFFASTRAIGFCTSLMAVVKKSSKP